MRQNRGQTTAQIATAATIVHRAIVSPNVSGIVRRSLRVSLKFWICIVLNITPLIMEIHAVPMEEIIFPGLFPTASLSDPVLYIPNAAAMMPLRTQQSPSPPPRSFYIQVSATRKALSGPAAPRP